MLHEGVVLLCRAFGQGLEPVGVVCHAQFGRPAFHAFGYLVGDVPVEGSPVVHGIDQAAVDRRGEVFEHLFPVEHVLAEIFRRTFCGVGYFLRLGAEGSFYDSES